MATLTAIFSGGYLSLSGGAPKTTAAPPINASSPDEADFIKYTPTPYLPLSSLGGETIADVVKQEVHGGGRGRLEGEGETLDG